MKTVDFVSKRILVASFWLFGVSRVIVLRKWYIFAQKKTSTGDLDGDRVHDLMGMEIW